MKTRLSSFPTVSVVIATYNSERTLARSLSSIRGQTYPAKKIEIIVVDGGSQDQTRTIAKRFGCTVLSVDPGKQNAEYNKSIGIQHATGDILAMIDHDNVLPHALWLRRMIEPFQKHGDVVGAETLRYHYDPKTTLIDRYFALFGAADPLVWYMKKTDRLSFIYDQYNLAGDAKDMGDFYLVRFQPDNIPTIGANGFLVRRDVLMKHAQVAPGKYFDMDVNVDLITSGFTTYAFVKDSILHLTGYGSVGYFLKRRLLFLTQYRFTPSRSAMKKVRRYGAISSQDVWLLIRAVVICSTLIVPLYDSLRGWRKIRDIAWFLHPLLCVSFVVVYSWAIIRLQIYTYGKKLLES